MNEILNTMDVSPDKVDVPREQRATANVKIGCRSDVKMFVANNLAENEVLRVCQALLFSTYILLLSYHSFLHGTSEFSVLDSGQIILGYKHKAVVIINFGYSAQYSSISILAIGMLAYSLVSKRPRWSLPSIVLHLPNLVYNISAAIVAIWLFFAKLPLPTAVSYSTASATLILADVWMWLGVLRLYEQRTFK